MHIGLIGGIGPAATVAYYTRLVQAFKKLGLPLELTIAHADITALAANAIANQKQLQAEIFSKHIAQLEGAGCDVAMITALTGHFCFEETNNLSSIPLINGIEIIGNYCEKQAVNVLGLLGSPPVMATGLFGLLRNVEIVVPVTNLEALGSTYMQVATTGHCTEESRQQFFAAGVEMTNLKRAEAILLAGTDLGIVFDGHTPGFRVIDALELHVNALVEMAKN